MTYDKTDEIVPEKKAFLELYLELKNQNREVHTEYYIYDWVSFFAEFGGIVGFLLGYSVLSFYDKVVDFLSSFSK